MARALAITNATLVTPDGPKKATLRLQKGRILSVGSQPEARDTVIPLPGHVIYPGLVNAHDHLELNHFPPTRWRDVYANAHAWGHDALAHLSDPEIAAKTALLLRQRLFFGGMKNLLSGVTTVAHHNPLYRPLHSRRFPVGVVRRYGWTHSLEFGEDVAGSYRRTPNNVPWIIHLAEGTDEVAARELDTLAQLGGLGDNTVLVHGVGLSERDRERSIAAGAGLVWCPATNLFLLDSTGEVGDFADAGRLAVGTDSRLTGSRDLLEELRVAAQISQLDSRQLFAAVTTDAAALLRLDDVGVLRQGARADLIALQAGDDDPYQLLLSASRSDLRLVMLAGKPRISDTDLLPFWEATRSSYQHVSLDARPKLLASNLFRQQHRVPLREPGLEINKKNVLAQVLQ
jgi:cytosine/adenosine deaminase-related metal-dependent hydrolase